MADKSSSPDSGETLYTVSVKCCGRPPLKPGWQVTWKESVDSLVTEQFWTASGFPEKIKCTKSFVICISHIL